ncbi:uncharacterized protein LOC130665635 [Microplitis mediator]|uniref:uncharacterized protein LOC130665635 n=1 Tax=Microplitis mediator TaxID=375433 RepID=UPI0025563728|nr:uncharacterized protein LOC130665635 [Microplitis mediator]
MLSLIIYVIIITLLITTITLIINGTILYSIISKFWIPPIFVSNNANNGIINNNTCKKYTFNEKEYCYYIIESKNLNLDFKTDNLMPIIWFTGDYFQSTKIQKYFFEMLSYNTGRTVCVFEYPTCLQEYLYETMHCIINLLHNIVFPQLRIKINLDDIPLGKVEDKDKFILAGNNSGCFYAMLYLDYLINTKKQFIVYECIFFDGIYNILSVPNPYYRWLWKRNLSYSKNICEEIENCSLDRSNCSDDKNAPTKCPKLSKECENCLRFHHCLNNKRFTPVDINVITSNDKFHYDINESFVKEDNHHRTLTELPRDSINWTYFYYYEKMQSIIAKCFRLDSY